MTLRITTGSSARISSSIASRPESPAPAWLRPRLDREGRLEAGNRRIELVALTGDIYYGLWYPIVVAVLTVVIGALFLPEKREDVTPA